MSEETSRYLGDGVYVSFDGYHIWLATGDHRNKVVALEPKVFNKLLEYQADIKKQFKEAE